LRRAAIGPLRCWFGAAAMPVFVRLAPLFGRRHVSAPALGIDFDPASKESIRARPLPS
jgi:hypothetical protein